MLRQKVTEQDANAVEESAKRRGHWLSTRRSNRNVASDQASGSRQSSSVSGGRAPINGSVSSSYSSQPQSQQRPPTWGTAPAVTTGTSGRGSVASSGHAGDSYGAPVQRPVEMSNPHRAMRR